MTGLTLAPEDALVRPGNPRHGADFQANLAMSLGKRLGRDPRELADSIVGELDVEGVAAPPLVAGPGFISFRLEDAWIDGALRAVAADPRLGAGADHDPQRVVIDYSAPNIAKEMHVGHLRSTIIGDALARILRFVGDDVIAQNHVGDWGTQFGMLIEELGDTGWSAGAGTGSIADLDAFYRRARAHFDADAAFADRARARVVALQAGDPRTLAAWRQLVDESQRHFDVVYDMLGVGLTATDMAGESMYHDLLAGTVDALREAGLLELDGGALCAFPDGFRNRDGERMPLIVRKSDGGHGYAASDLAAIRHRAGTLGAERILYVVGAPQRQHLRMVFATGRAAGWLGDGVEAEHVAFGSVLGEDGRILRTRAGENVRLVDLLREAVVRAGDAIARRTGAADDELARRVGIGAVKYADLSNDRVHDYVFSFDRMLALEGNTSVYLQYAQARAASVLLRAGDDMPAAAAPVAVREDAERALALALLQFGPAVGHVASSLQPHRLCTYLYETATAFSAFYERCPILKAGDPATRATRLELTRHTGAVLRTGLDLLGIDAPQQL
ncbi:MAG: arginine--tRNA ligase [Solirubrobacteraceae bacterium]